MGALCRSTCGVTRFLFSDTIALPLLIRFLRMVRSTASR